MGTCFGAIGMCLADRRKRQPARQPVVETLSVDIDEKQAHAIGELFRVQDMSAKHDDRLCMVEQYLPGGFVGVRFFDESLNDDTPFVTVTTNLKRTTMDKETRFFY